MGKGSQGERLASAGGMTLTTRLKPDLAEALRRATAERSVFEVRPYTTQDIVIAALTDWLQTEGHWPPT
jgi:hypothetical protein